MSDEEATVVDPRTVVDADMLKKKATEVTSTVVNRTYATVHFAIQTPTSRYVAAVLAECARYAGDRARRGLVKLQRRAAGDAEMVWSHADDVADGERWLTLSWYERQLVEPRRVPQRDGDRPASASASASGSAASSSTKSKGEARPAVAHFEGGGGDDDFAKWAKERALGEDPDEEAGYHLATLAAVAPAEWQLNFHCAACRSAFGPALHRHHCRLCGRSVCRAHGSRFRPLPSLAAHLGAAPQRAGQEKGDSTSLQRGYYRSYFREKSIHALSSPREMIARPKMSQIQWETIEI